MSFATKSDFEPAPLILSKSNRRCGSSDPIRIRRFLQLVEVQFPVYNVVWLVHGSRYGAHSDFVALRNHRELAMVPCSRWWIAERAFVDRQLLIVFRAVCGAKCADGNNDGCQGERSSWHRFT